MLWIPQEDWILKADSLGSTKVPVLEVPVKLQIYPGATEYLALQTDIQWTWRKIRRKNGEKVEHLHRWMLHIMPNGTTQPVMSFNEEPYPLPRGERRVRKEATDLTYGVWYSQKYLTRREFTLVTFHRLLFNLETKCKLFFFFYIGQTQGTCIVFPCHLSFH
jgi:hypothetical protein